MKMSQFKNIIREVVREEIRIGLKEIIGELKQSSREMKKPQVQKPRKPQTYSKNSVLNDVLNETANDDWETLGGTQFTSDRMGELLGGTMKDDDTFNANGTLVREMGMNPNDPAADFLKKDYRKLMNAVDKKQGK